MSSQLKLRHGLKWALIALGSLFGVVILAVVGTAALVDAGYFHAPILRYLVAKTGRQIRVAGPVHTHLLSLHPRFTAGQVVIGNPPWMPPGDTAEIAQLSAEIDLSLFAPWSIGRLELQAAKLHLLRDAKGLANWRARPVRSSDGPPLIHSLSMREAQVDLHDARRHLDFEGRVTAVDGPVINGQRPLRVEGSGQLNGRAVNITVDGDPLATASRSEPYAFSFEERSSGSRLTGRGALSQPFDFRRLTTDFDAAGQDMQDLYFLTGLTLPDTGAYKLSGKLARNDLRFTFADLVATTGGSDMRGRVSVDTTGERPQIEAQMHSQVLRLKDLGKKAAGRAAEVPHNAPALPDTPFRLTALRRDDAVLKFGVDHLDAGFIQLKSAAAQMKVDHGRLSIDPSATFGDGSLSGRLVFDASYQVPKADINLRFAGLRLEQFDKHAAGEPPFEGLLHGRVNVKGQGISAHKIAASAEGKITVVLPHGAMRASLAELAGVDLRGIGLTLSGNKKSTQVRCAVASFDIDKGVVSTRSVVVDTTPVLITGTGTIDLNSEAIDLSFRGQPKHLRLRLRAPLTVRGTLSNPDIGVGSKNSAAQGGAAVALGVLLTPLAAILAFVDPGLTKDADCASLLAEAGAAH